MPNTLSTAQLLKAKQMISAGNLLGFYQYMAEQGYKYATLAEGVVSASAPNGLAALGFMQASAINQGHPLSDAQINKIKIDMANGWADALIGVASTNGKVNADLTGQAILTMHNDVFLKNNLDPSTWTLHAPAQILGPTQFNALFQDLLNVQGNTALEIAMDAKIFFQMEACAQYCPDPGQQNAALKWIGTAAGSVFNDVDFFLQRSKGAVVPSGLNLNNLKGNSLSLGDDVDIRALADQLAEPYIPKSSTWVASSGLITDISADPTSSAAANAATRQQLVQLFSDQLQALRGGTGGIHYDLTQQTASGQTIDSITHFFANGNQQYKQIADTSATGLTSVAISGTGDVAKFNQAIFSLASSTSATVSGNSNAINAGDHSTVTLFGLANTVNLDSGSGSWLNIGGSSSATVCGMGNGILFTGTSSSISSKANTINFSTDEITAYVTGDSNAINAKARSITNITGTANMLNLISGSSSTVNFGAYSSATVRGVNNTIGICGTGENIIASNCTFWSTADGYSTTIAGDSSTINVGRYSFTSLSGSYNLVNFQANSDSLVHLDRAYSSNTIRGTGNTIGVMKTGQYIVASNETINSGADGLSTTIAGDSSTLNVGRYSFTSLSGNYNLVNFQANSGSLIHLDQAYSSNTIRGTGNTIGVMTTGQYIVASNETINFGAEGLSTTIAGDSSTINAGRYSFTSLSGNYNLVNFQANSGSLVHLDQAYSANTINGSGNTIGVMKTGQYIVASNETINFGAEGLSATIAGDSSTINAGRYSFTSLSGNHNLVKFQANSGSLVHLEQAYSANTINGGGNTIGIMTTGQYVVSSSNTINYGADGFTTTLEGNGNIINAARHSVINVYGTDSHLNFSPNSGALAKLYQDGATAIINGTSNIVELIGNGISLHATGQAIVLAKPGMVATIAGNANAIVADNSTLNVSGNNITIAGGNHTINAAANSTVYVNGPNCVVNGSNLTVILGKGIEGSKVTINGNHNAYTTDGDWVKQPWQLSVDCYGDFNYYGFVGVAGGHFNGYNNQSYLHQSGDINFGAFGAPPLAFPHFDFVTNNAPNHIASVGGLDTGYLADWVHGENFDTSHIYFPTAIQVIGDKLPVSEHGGGYVSAVSIPGGDTTYFDPNGNVVANFPTPYLAVVSTPSPADVLQSAGEQDVAFDSFLINVTKSVPIASKDAPSLDLENVALGAQPAADANHDADVAFLGKTASVPASLYEHEHVMQYA